MLGGGRGVGVIAVLACSSRCSRLKQLLSLKSVCCSSSVVSNEEGRVVCQCENPLLKHLLTLLVKA